MRVRLNEEAASGQPIWLVYPLLQLEGPDYLGSVYAAVTKPRGP